MLFYFCYCYNLRVNLPRFHLSFKTVIASIVFAFIATFIIQLVVTTSLITRLNTEIATLKNDQKDFKDNFSEGLFNEHLKVMEIQSLNGKLTELESQIIELQGTPQNSEYLAIKDLYTNYALFLKNNKRNQDVSLKLPDVDTNSWGEMLLNKKYEELKADIDKVNATLEVDYKDYLATLPPPPSASGEGYSYVNVGTSRGTFGVSLIKVNLATVKVKTVAANDDTCRDNCKTKSLAEYVSEMGGFAGMNGGYFCPPDYSSCSGKVNSFDFALYNSRSGEWMSDNALSWGDTGMLTFNGSSASFYKKTSDYGGGSVSAAISNYPSLVKDSSIVVDSDDLTTFQKDVRGPRGVIGIGGENLYLAIVYNATVIDAAYVLQALGAKHALNLDGGGSTAMYINGSYVAGPGRSLPNAIVLTR